MNTRPEVRRVALFVAVAVSALALAVLGLRDTGSPLPANAAAQELLPERAERPHSAPIGSDPGTKPASAPLQRADGSGTTRRLRVVSAAELAPLPGCELTLVGPQGATRTLRTDDDGHAPWPDALAAGRAVVTVEHEGYAPLRGHLAAPSADGELVLALELAGRVEIAVVDRDGRPVADVGVALLPPACDGAADWSREWPTVRANGVPAIEGTLLPQLRAGVDGIVRAGAATVRPRELPAIELPTRVACAHGWTATSDRDGIARFDDVATGTGYRFGVLGATHVRVEPANERTRLTVTPRGVRVGAPAPFNLSGTLDVVAQETARGRATTLGSCAVHGRITGVGAQGVLVKLARISQAGGGDSGVEAVTAIDAERTSQSSDGAFRFENVRPGIFALRACWLRGQQDIHFVSTTLRLDAEDDVDLGALAPMDGARATVRVDLSAGGQPVAATDVFDEAASYEAVLTIAFQPDSQTVADAVTEFARVPFGSEFVLHGVPSGSLKLQARPAPGLAPRASVQRVDSSGVVEDRVERLGGGTVVVAVPVVGGVPRVFDVRGPDGEEVPAVQVQVRNRTTGRVDGLQISEAGRAPIVERVARFEPGVYDAWLSLQRGGVWLAAAFEVDATDPAAAVVHVTLEAAGEVRGTLVDPRGRPLPDTTLRWTPTTLAGSGIWTFPVRSGADGTFVISGVPAGVQLVAEHRPGLPLPAAVAGQVLQAGNVVLDPAAQPR
jgi:hypothetical protein